MICTKIREYQLALRIPSWVNEATVLVNGQSIKEKVVPGNFLVLTRKWGKENQIELLFPMQIRTHISLEQAAHRGTEIYHINWLGFTRGPLVYTTDGLINNREREEKFSLSQSQLDQLLTECETPTGYHGPAYQLKIPEKEPVLYLPYYEAGGRQNGTWRLTWIQVDWK